MINVLFTSEKTCWSVDIVAQSSSGSLGHLLKNTKEAWQCFCLLTLVKSSNQRFGITIKASEENDQGFWREWSSNRGRFSRIKILDPGENASMAICNWLPLVIRSRVDKDMHFCILMEVHHYRIRLTKLLEVCLLLQDLKSEQTRHFAPGLMEKTWPWSSALLVAVAMII